MGKVRDGGSTVIGRVRVWLASRWYRFERTCHDTALSHCVCPEAALKHTDPFVVGGAERATCKVIRSGISEAALGRRGLRQAMNGLHGRPREAAQHRRPRWVADLRNPTARTTSGTLPLGRFIPMHPRQVWYTEKAPNAWHRRGTQKTRNTYKQPNRPNRHTYLTDQASSTTARTAWETHDAN